jgi:hypothetical protein
MATAVEAAGGPPQEWTEGAPVPGRAGRLLALALGDDTRRGAAALRAFAVIALFHLATERGAMALSYAGSPTVSMGWWLFAVSIGLLSLGALVLGLQPAYQRKGLVLGLATQLVYVAVAFPLNANHDLLVLLVLGLACAFDLERDDERQVLLACARWLMVIVLFTTGVQKLMYGTYFHGEFLGVRIAHSDTFAAAFQYLLPEQEFQRLRGLGEGPTTQGLSLFAGERIGHLPAPGTGSYRVDSPLFRVVSNSVWIFEMAAPFFLIWRRTRVLAAIATLGFLAVIELGAREYFFGLIFSNLVLLFLPGRVHEWARPFFAVAYLAVFVRKALVLNGWLVG